MEIRKDNKLESLSPDKRQWICEIAAAAGRLIDVLPILKDEGIEVSVSTLGRFVRRHREQRLMNDAEDMKGAVDHLATRGRGEALRKGTLEAVRQRIFERALISNDPEEARRLYRELLDEESRLREFELEERRAALAEENLKLQRERLKLDTAKAALKLLPEALRILCDERMDDRMKVAEARRCLVGWKGAVAVEAAVDEVVEQEAPRAGTPKLHDAGGFPKCAA